MGALAGFGGTITLSGKTAGVQAWAIDEVGDVLEVTTLASGQTREFIAGLQSYTGTLTAIWDGTDTISVGDSGELTLNCGNSSGFAYICAAVIITGIGRENAHDGIVQAPISFQGTGALPSRSSSSSSSSSSG